ncbi:hypothetical protein D3C76_232490 [compost metagenome]
MKSRKQVIEETVSNIKLDWLTGEVRILPSEMDHVQIVQYMNNRFPDKKMAQVVQQSGILHILDGRKRSLIGFNLNTTTLEVYLPKKKLHSITINGTGSHLYVQALEAQMFKIQLTSSHATVTGGSCDKCEINAVGTNFIGEDVEIQELNLCATSSKVEISGELSEIHANSTGRGIKIQSSIVPCNIQSVSTGAGVTLGIPENDGFVLEFQKVSGHLKSDFPLIPQGRSYTYKDGGKLYRAEVRGGRFSLQKTIL